MPNRFQLLLVEDDDAVAKAITKALAWKTGDAIDVTRASSVADARGYLEALIYDWVVLDPGLPDAKGERSIHSVCDAAGGTPVTILTGGLRDAASEDAAKRAVGGIVMKPIDLDHLVDQLFPLLPEDPTPSGAEVEAATHAARKARKLLEQRREARQKTPPGGLHVRE